MGYYQRRDAAAEHSRQQARNEADKHGHDYTAAGRLATIVTIEANYATFAPNLSDDLRTQLRTLTDEKIAAIRASGPVGCTCSYRLCAESQPATPNAS